MPKKITLYDYQQQPRNILLSYVRDHLCDETIRMLMVMATGLGKTLTAAVTLQEILEMTGIVRTGRMLFLCHSTDILNNARREFQRVFPVDTRYGSFDGVARDVNADLLFATFQSMASCKERFEQDAFDVVLVDESHHGQAPTYKKVIGYFTPRILLGMTATPDRADMKNIRDLFGDELVDIPLARGIANNWLAPVDYHLISDNLNQEFLDRLVQDVVRDGKRFSLKQINRTLFIRSKDKEIAARIIEQDRKAIIFCRSIEHAMNFEKYLPNAVTCHSKKSATKNKIATDGYRSGDVRYILVVDKFNEGVDIPDTTMLVFLRGTDSKNVFLHQLGRGLRLSEGKNDVLVFDFAGNCERILNIQELVKQIEVEVPPTVGGEPGIKKDIFQVSGKGFSINFDIRSVAILEILEKLSVRKDFYPTWQEASEAAQRLGAKSFIGYHKCHKKDKRLPSNPNRHYPDFPGWQMFLGNKSVNWPGYYLTCKEASEAAQRLEMQSQEEYRERYKEDERLPSNPQEFYSDWPIGGNESFFGRKSLGWLGYYPTWQEASEAVQRLGIKKISEYNKRYKEDERLPSTPCRSYDDWPGDSVFYGGKPLGWLGYYPTCKEAFYAMHALGIKSRSEYRDEYTRDKRLHSNPDVFYDDFPGWDVFLGRKSWGWLGYYPTCKEASEAARLLGIANAKEYESRYKEDSRLVSTPRKFYANFPGWGVFLGKKKT